MSLATASLLPQMGHTTPTDHAQKLNENLLVAVLLHRYTSFVAADNKHKQNPEPPPPPTPHPLYATEFKVLARAQLLRLEYTGKNTDEGCNGAWSRSIKNLAWLYGNTLVS